MSYRWTIPHLPGLLGPQHGLTAAPNSNLPGPPGPSAKR
jgi:hypothetical protein